MTHWGRLCLSSRLRQIRRKGDTWNKKIRVPARIRNRRASLLKGPIASLSFVTNAFSKPQLWRAAKFRLAPLVLLRRRTLNSTLCSEREVSCCGLAPRLFQAFFLLFQQPVDLARQLEESLRVLLDCRLFAEFFPALFAFALHGVPIEDLLKSPETEFIMPIGKWPLSIGTPSNLRLRRLTRVLGAH